MIVDARKSNRHCRCPRGVDMFSREALGRVEFNVRGQGGGVRDENLEVGVDVRNHRAGGVCRAVGWGAEGGGGWQPYTGT